MQLCPKCSVNPPVISGPKLSEIKPADIDVSSTRPSPSRSQESRPPESRRPQPTQQQRESETVYAEDANAPEDETNNKAKVVLASFALIVAALLIFFALFLALDKTHDVTRSVLLSTITSFALVAILSWVYMLVTLGSNSRGFAVLCILIPPLALFSIFVRPDKVAFPLLLNIMAIAIGGVATLYYEQLYKEWPHETIELILPAQQEEDTQTLKSFW